MKALTFGRAAWLTMGVGSCLPLTFVHDGVIDFDVYPVVYIDSLTGDAPGFARAYLADEMTRESGFTEVTTRTGTPYDLILAVDLFVREDIETDEDGDRSTSYEATASFSAAEPNGTVVDYGSVDDSGGDRNEAIEDALDEVAHHYLRPYRF